MLCPVDGETLLMSERQGVEIDYCPRCRGVWLDRGELDKIIERSETPDQQVRAASARSDNPPSKSRPQRREERDDEENRKSSGKPYRKKRSLTKSFLEDIFDFD